MATKSNSEWLSALRAGGRAQEEAFTELRLLLLRAIKNFLAQKKAYNSPSSDDSLRHAAEDCAQESILVIQSKLDGFRGESQFTTWAYSIAIRVTLGELRRREWRRKADEKLPVGEAVPAWPIDEDDPERTMERLQAWATVNELIQNSLTPLQRKALVAHAFQEMPLDLVAEWLGTNRNNVYKLIHDARKRLKAALLERGLAHRDIIAIFARQKKEMHTTSFGKIPVRQDI